MVSDKEARQIAAGLIKQYADLSQRRGWTLAVAAKRIGLTRSRWHALRVAGAPMVKLQVYLSLLKELEKA